MLTHLFTGALTIAMLGVMGYDMRYYLITNRMNLFLLALFVLAAFLLPVSFWPAVTAATCVFVLGFGIFSLGLMGGGDVKLLAVLSLWAGWPGAGYLLFLTAMCGGVLVVIILLLRAALPGVWLRLFPTRNLPRILTRKQPIPYGLAIASAFLLMLWTGQIAVLA